MTKAEKLLVDRKATGANIKRLRNAKGLFQWQLADEIGVQNLQVGKWERGQQLPHDFNLNSLAEFFGVATESIIVRRAG